jgi:hypothetical protein
MPRPVDSHESKAMSAENKPDYRITLNGEGIDVTQQVDQATARLLLNILLEGHIARPSDPIEDISAAMKPRHSLREFLDDVEANRNPEKIVAIGEHLAISEGQADFSRDDIRGKFRAAGEAAPRNFSRDFSWSISNGWIAEDSQNKGRFYVTKTGKEAIQARFSPEIKKKSIIKPPRRKRPQSQ